MYSLFLCLSGLMPNTSKNRQSNNPLWFSVLMSDIENAFLSSFGMLSQSSTLAILIAVREALKWKLKLPAAEQWGIPA